MALAKYYEDILERQIQSLEKIQAEILIDSDEAVDYQTLKNKLTKDIELLKKLIEECLELLTEPNNSNILYLREKVEQITEYKNSIELSLLEKNQKIVELESNLANLTSRKKDLDEISRLRKLNMQLQSDLTQHDNLFSIKNKNLISSNSQLLASNKKLEKNKEDNENLLKTCKQEIKEQKEKIRQLEIKLFQANNGSDVKAKELSKNITRIPASEVDKEKYPPVKRRNRVKTKPTSEEKNIKSKQNTNLQNMKPKVTLTPEQQYQQYLAKYKK